MSSKARGLKKHLKRLNAPKHWMLDKLGGAFGRFRLHSLKDEEAKFKLCKVRSVQFGQKGIPYLNTYDGRTIRNPDPLIKANDTIKLDLETNKIVDFIKEKHKGSFETIHIQDATGHEFERGQSRGYPFPMARVSSSALLKRHASDWLLVQPLLSSISAAT
ncbi:hypothetical protein Cni_G25243 [Canna indica]|uniref:40S ribosomal protein S4 n=1 Tax=Canna indica TaxID=4628 RepID=A0AAQ3QP96_9LILI|nr:hypothetical protein Cni_G25243 [Canna indica]